jgi:beta-galactosidase
MRIFKFNRILIVSLAAFLITSIASATMVERLDAKYLKSRIKLRIDEDWKIMAGNSTTASDSNFNDATWTTTNVPHDFSITLYKTTNAGTADPGALGWYRKHVTLPTGFAGKKVLLQFDGVYHDSKIWVNGHLVGNQQYGYVSFYFDITQYLSATGDNVIAVFVDNQTVRTSRWYSGTGIFRHVWLIATDMVYLRNWGMAVTTPVAATAQAQAKVQNIIVNDLTTSQTRSVETTIYDENGAAVQTASTPVTVAANSIDTCAQTLTLASCKLWSPSTPVRYYAYSRLLNGTTPADDYVAPFGVRQLQYVANQGLLINGTSYKMKGICMHAMAVPTGAAVPERMSERTIKELLASGCTSIRTSHNPVTPEFLDLCDQYGMLVLDEWCDKWSQASGGTFYENWDQVWKKDLAGFIERDRNHPSVVMWSVGNEVASGSPVPTYLTSNLKILTDYVKNIDKSRATTNACVAGSGNPASLAGLTNYEDIVGLNYMESQYSGVHSSNANALILGTEQAPYLAGNTPTWFSVKNNPYVIGHHLWMGVDFLGEGIGKGGPPSGYLDYCIFRKSWFYYQKSQWSDTPVVHIGIGDAVSPAPSTWITPFLSESWNQTGAVNVVTYTNCDSVILYVNTTKVGTKKLSDYANWIMQWPNTQWQTGVIKAVGMKGGKQAAVDSIKTVGAAAKVLLKPDRTTLYADGDDLCNLEADIVDADNNLVWDAVNSITLAISGQGRSLGIGNGDYTSDESYKALSRKAYNGRVYMPIQSTMVPGTITVTVSSTGLTSATLTLTTSGQTNTMQPGAPMVVQTGNRSGFLNCTRTSGTNVLRVSYRVDVPGTIHLSVITPSGRVVQSLTNGYHKEGTYSKEWNPTGKNGVYFFVLKTDNGSIVRKAFVVE